MAGAETRELAATEIKFLIDLNCARAISDWARSRIGPDPNAPDETGYYQTTSLYFDTASRDVLNQRGSYARSKYRVRRYGGGDGEGTFLERKLKKGGMVRKRRSVIGIGDLSRLAQGITESGGAERGWNGYWFHRRLLARQLRPVCQIAYRRLARVTETGSGPLRLTVDQEMRAHRIDHLRFEHGAPGILLSEKQPILELKFRQAMPELFAQLIEEFHLSPATVSKYRLAAAALGISNVPLDPNAECEADEQPATAPF